jgi:hypothetical protein
MTADFFLQRKMTAEIWKHGCTRDKSNCRQGAGIHQQQSRHHITLQRQ